MSFNSKQILSLFNALDAELKNQKLIGEIYLVGGAVMCLVFKARASTQDVDAFFQPSSTMRKLAKKVAHKMKVEENWLNDGVKGYLSPKGSFEPFLDLPNLKVYTAKPDYLLAMKALAMRIGEEFHDVDDVRYLIKYLNLTNANQAVEMITQYYPLEQFPQKTLYALEELFEK